MNHSARINNERFEIFRSDDGYSRESIIEVDGAGNSNSTIESRAIDESSLNGIYYYKLRRGDSDGQFQDSEIQVVELHGIMDISVYPNPT